MKHLILTFLALCGIAFGQSGLMVNKTTGAITSPVNAATFKSANGIVNGTGTVTSVAASVPSFLSISGSPITTSGTLAISLSGTALPVASGGTGITSLGSGIATFLGTPTSANLAAALTNETGTGAAVFAISPTFVTPILGTPTSVTLSNAMGLPISTGVSGLGAGVSSALSVALNGAGGIVGEAATSTISGVKTFSNGILLPSFKTIGFMNDAGVSNSTIYVFGGHSGGDELSFRAPRMYFEWTDGFQIGKAATDRDGAYVYVRGSNATAGDTIRESRAFTFYPTTWTTGAVVGEFISMQAVPLDTSGTNAELRFLTNAAINATTGVATGTSVFTIGNTGVSVAGSIATSSTSFTAFAGATTLLTIGGTGASASILVPSTLDATSSTTGAIRTSGGISAAKALNVGANITLGSNLNIPTTASASVGGIRQNGQNLIHTYAPASPSFTNTFIGPSAGNFTLTAQGTFAAGTSAGASLTSGSQNNLIGHQAGTALTTGAQNTFIGYRAGAPITTGASNLAYGSYALEGAAVGINANVAIGEESLRASTSSNQTAVGYQAFHAATGGGNAGVGAYSFYYLTTGDYNIALGGFAGFSIAAGSGSSKNIFIGTEAGFHASQATTVSNSIAIGYNAYTTASNQVVLGNSSVTATILRGAATAAKLGGSSSTPAVAAGAGAGTGGSVSVSGNNTHGEITITSGTLPTASAVIATITFSGAAFGTAPNVVMWPSGPNASTLPFLPYVTTTTTTFVINASTISLGGSTTYKYHYVVLGI